MRLNSLPRLLELEKRFGSGADTNFFKRFRTRLEGHSVTFNYYQKVERWISYVPPNCWDEYCAKVAATCQKFDRFRHWQGLHDVFNEALGAKLLACRFRCSAIEMLKPSDRRGKKSPDWRGRTKTKTTLVEVKTINHSQPERESWYRDTTLEATCVLSVPLKAKIQASYNEACIQLAAAAENGDRKVVFFVVNRDYNLDPIDRDCRDLILEFLTTIELREYPIFAHVQGP